jgi:hypothetical protein
MAHYLGTNQRRCLPRPNLSKSVREMHKERLAAPGSILMVHDSARATLIHHGGAIGSQRRF